MYDTYIVDHLKSARDSLYRLLVRYQMEKNHEAAISRLDYSAELDLPNHTSLFFLDISPREQFHRSVENIREKNIENVIALTFTELEQLMTAMTPNVLPAAILHKPVEYDQLLPLLSALEVKTAEEHGDRVFSYTHKARTTEIPHKNILYFESRSKKTYLVTEAMEYELYVTLDSLEEELKEGFVRTHRSYLVNRSRITDYDFGSMTATLDEGSVVLISRSGKANLKG